MFTGAKTTMDLKALVQLSWSTHTLPCRKQATHTEVAVLPSNSSHQRLDPCRPWSGTGSEQRFSGHSSRSAQVTGKFNQIIGTSCFKQRKEVGKSGIYIYDDYLAMAFGMIMDDATNVVNKNRLPLFNASV
ncbi:hypothetical protein V6N13_015921 [Hibiscus sabdariffa]|uniref:Uncharacterized protein n=1 Tax=Hibiscus sabdariffa TaxID=183260 RepID=A0ABR2CYS8_9ROSI